MAFKRTRVKLENAYRFRLSCSLLVLINMSLFSVLRLEAFLVAKTTTKFRFALSSAFSNSRASDDPSKMRLREIQLELKQRNVPFADCFDRDSLTKRLLEAREESPIQQPDDGSTPADEVAPTTKTERLDSVSSSHAARTDANGEFDKQAVLAELRNLKIKELREQLSQFRVRWGNMIEKEELVQALCKAMEDRYLKSQNFSRSGEVIVGEVCDASDDVLLQELGWSGSDLKRGIITSPTADNFTPSSHPPLLLDVYATW